MASPRNTQHVWQLSWPYGRSETHALGGMTAPVEFHMPGGQVFSPLLVAPWVGEPMAGNIPGHLRNLRGVFPCLPFGISEIPIEAEDAWRRLVRQGEVNPQHGPGANGLWKMVANDGTELQIVFGHSKRSAFARSLQFIRPDPYGPAIDFLFTAEAQRDVSLPFGQHVLLRWPDAPARILLDPAPFAFGLSYPGALTTNGSTTSPGRSFTRLYEVPALDSGSIDFNRPRPQAQTEELIMLCGMEGRFDIAYPDEGFGLRILWDGEVLPSCLVWFSRGPGIEPRDKIRGPGQDRGIHEMVIGRPTQCGAGGEREENSTRPGPRERGAGGETVHAKTTHNSFLRPDGFRNQRKDGARSRRVHLKGVLPKSFF